jgi:hypothetical protein
MVSEVRDKSLLVCTRMYEYIIGFLKPRERQFVWGEGDRSIPELLIHYIQPPPILSPDQWHHTRSPSHKRSNDHLEAIAPPIDSLFSGLRVGGGPGALALVHDGVPVGCHLGSSLSLHSVSLCLRRAASHRGWKTASALQSFPSSENCQKLFKIGYLHVRVLVIYYVQLPVRTYVKWIFSETKTLNIGNFLYNTLEKRKLCIYSIRLFQKYFSFWFLKSIYVHYPWGNIPKNLTISSLF